MFSRGNSVHFLLLCLCEGFWHGIEYPMALSLAFDRGWPCGPDSRISDDYSSTIQAVRPSILQPAAGKNGLKPSTSACILSSGIVWRQIEGREAVAECVAVFGSIISDVSAAPFFLHCLAIAVDFAHHDVVPSSQPPELKYRGVDRQAKLFVFHCRLVWPWLLFHPKRL